MKIPTSAQKIVLLLSLFLGLGEAAGAQIIIRPLPYYTGFEDSAQYSGWVHPWMNSPLFEAWEPGGVEVPGMPGVYDINITHEYNYYGPIQGPDTAGNDWMVSPGFDLSKGGWITSVRVSAFIDSNNLNGPNLSSNDEFSVYLVRRQENYPFFVTPIAKLADFTLYASPQFSWHTFDSIAIPPAPGISHIAFNYRITNSRYVARVDDIEITANKPTAAGSIRSASAAAFRVYPIPAARQLLLDFEDGKTGACSIRLTDLGGRLVTLKGELPRSLPAKLDVSALPDGMYNVSIATAEGAVASRLVSVKH